ncbi:VanZ family protein [Luteimonas dalianensis]|uniref:VanZ family protein n=1 Tax=Luteimonas dalianensis TaxID=1148196 RepID=UPI003BF2D7B1
MISVYQLLLGVMVLGIAWFLARRGRPLVRVLVFASALVVSALLFLPGGWIRRTVGRDALTVMGELAAHTPWAVAEWVHFLIFLWLGLLLWLGRSDLRNWKGWGLVMVLAVGAEMAQALAPNREPRLGDVMLNLAGGMAGILLAIGLRRLFRRW